MRQIVIIALAYGITPLLMALTILLAWWMAKQDGADRGAGGEGP